MPILWDEQFKGREKDYSRVLLNAIKAKAEILLKVQSIFGFNGSMEKFDKNLNNFLEQTERKIL